VQMNVRLHYNAPVVLTFTLLCTTVRILSDLTNNAMLPFFTTYPNSDPFTVLYYIRFFTHSIGHIDWQHLLGNMSFILLLGPMLEEKYGPKKMILMIIITALATGLLNNLLFNSSLMGASGIVFMFIILSSFANVKDGDIPLTFIFVVVLFIGNEIYSTFKEDNISQFAHILGGLCGSFFGFSLKSKKLNI
jgi:membrane associated rhomboid family serine protease